MNSTIFENKTNDELVELASNKFKKEGDIEYFMQAMEFIIDRSFPDVEFYYDSFSAVFVSEFNGKNRGKIENFIAACSNCSFLDYLEAGDEEEMMSYMEYWLYLDPFSYDLKTIKSVHKNIKKWGSVCA
jgi:hypothetical protein